jgi:hypothetical protein
MQGAIQCLISALDFKYLDFKLTRHDARRLDTLLDNLAKQGKLLRGKWRKGVFLGTVLFEKMARAWLHCSLNEGCLS